tara:strand:- start:5779 stop:7590 length:1812 start_codon:yes stop_codon:yes gene_type:complete
MSTQSNSPQDTSLVGQSLGDYQILRRLGRGGMSIVYLAEQQSLKRRVAFKVLKPELAKDAVYVRRFHKEAQAAASLVHANIVQIYEVGEIKGIHYIVQEYVPGQNLAQYIRRHSSVSVPLSIVILKQVAAALHRASDQGITHRDIKPENIMLSTSGEVKVADFGLARVTSGEHHVDTTQVGITMGTPLYMSPEQAEGGSVDPRSDIYSLGVTSYHMLTGRPPFEGETALSVAVQHLKREPEPVSEVRSGIPVDLAAVVMKMLEKQPDNRFQRADDLQKQLRSIPVSIGEDTWPDDLDHIDCDEVALADARIEATQQLDALMKTQGQQILGSTNGKLWIAATVLLFATGVLLGSLPYSEEALETPDEVVEIIKIEKRDTVEAQYLYASVVNSEEAYLSVEEYFPIEENPQNYHYVTLSHQRIADLHLEAANYPAAEAYYMELYYLAPEERHFRAYGIAGLANVYNRTNGVARMADRLIELGEVLPLLNDDIQSEIMDRLDTELRDIVEQFQADATRQSTPPDSADGGSSENESVITSALYRQLSELSKSFSELPSFREAGSDIQNEILTRFEEMRKLIREQNEDESETPGEDKPSDTNTPNESP